MSKYQQRVTSDSKGAITVTLIAEEDAKGSFPRTGKFYGGSFGLTGSFGSGEPFCKAMQGRLKVTLVEQTVYNKASAGFVRIV